MELKLEPSRVRKFLNPWLERNRGRFRVLADPVVREVITNSIQRGITADALRSAVSSFFPSSNELKSFIYKIESAVRDFSQKESSFASYRRQNSPPRYSRDVKHEWRPVHHSEPKREQKPEPEPEPSRSPSVALPSFFVSSEMLSLRKCDQKVKPLRLNESGQQVDEFGNVIKTQFIHKTADTTHRKQPDRPIKSKPVTREFHFLEPGSIIKKVEEKARKKELDRSVAEGFPIFDVIALQRDVETPAVDWWDLPFVQLDDNQNPVTDDDGNWIPNVEHVNCDYQNAAPVPVPQPKVKEIPTMLTEQERKRIKHIAKLEKRNEEHLMIKLNLKEKEPQKLKASQMINFAGGKAVLSPTEVAMSIKKARDERIQKHEEANAARKLTKEQKQEKESAKRESDADENLTITIYSIKSLTNPLHFAKLTSMAQKWFMTGGIFIVKHPSMNFVVIESGPKGTRKYGALVNQRIRWNELQDGTEIENAFDVSYQGPLFKRHFYNFRKYVFDVATQCREFFQKQEAEHLFDAAARFFS